jgi:aryl-alcohol dehydrogenase-like predicted oxidoreductase
MYNAVMEGNGFGRTDLPVSRLGLGTAEIGFAYGLGSPQLPSEDDAIRLLQKAVELGVTFFDTANYYGCAEERIGKSGILKNPEVVVCTKCAQFLEKGESYNADEIEKKIRTQIDDSRRQLRLDTLPLVLLHGPSALQLEERMLPKLMHTLQIEGVLRYWGASVRGEEPALAAIAAGADAIQVAYSIADQRMAVRVLRTAQEQGVGVINRSIYLKGVFAGKAWTLTESLTPLKVVAEKARYIADELGMPLPELALRFTLSEPAIGIGIVGTAKPEHLEHAVGALSKGPLPADVVESLRGLALEDPDQIDPARWPK